LRQHAAYRPAEQEFHTFKSTCTGAVPNWSNPPGGLRTFGAKTGVVRIAAAQAMLRLAVKKRPY